jgi:predicted nucleic acid-binding protein
VLVVDASVVAPLIADGGDDGERCRAAVAGQTLAAPDVLRVEVVSVLRRQVARSELTEAQGDNAVEDLLALPIVLYPTTPLVRRIWQMRSNVSSYDGAYVALAELLDSALLTADARLAKAPSAMCRFQLV